MYILTIIRRPRAAAEYHNRKVRGLEGLRRVEIDVLWSYVYAKDGRSASDPPKNVPEEAGSAWTFTALDADTKLMISYLVADRYEFGAGQFIQDLCSRLARPPQITSDGFKPYINAIEDAFGVYSNYAQVIKTLKATR